MAVAVERPKATILPASFLTRDIQPPSFAYIGPSDFLQIAAWANVGAQTITVQGRILRTDGQVIPFSFTVAPAATRVVVNTFFPLEEGYLLGLFASASAGSFGQLAAKIQLNKSGSTPPDFAYQILSQGIVENKVGLAWPPGTFMAPVTIAGTITAVVGTAPAAGAEVSQTVPTGARWRLKGVVVSLVTAVAVANRAPTIIIDDGTNTAAQYQAAAVQAASLTRTIVGAAIGAAPDLTAPVIPVFMAPDIPMLAGWRIRTSTTNLQAADAYGTPIFYVEETLDPT